MNYASGFADLLTIMIGIFGTILGFYYGSPPAAKDEPPQTITLESPGPSNVIVAPSEQTTSAAWTSGGLPTMKYDLYVVSTDANGTGLLIVKPQAPNQ